MRAMLSRAALTAALILTPAAAQEAATPPLPPVEVAALPTIIEQPIAFDRSERMTLPVYIGGEGPFAFVIDTGAERSVIARELAQRLNLSSAGRARVIGIAETVTADLFHIDRLALQSIDMGRRVVPAFAYRDLGAAGLVGIDGLEGHSVRLDFIRQRIDIRESPVSRRPQRDPEMDRDAIVVTARRRAGRLILSDAELGGERIDIIVDTGAQTSIGNRALQALVRRERGQRGPLIDGQVLGVTGAMLPVNMGVVERMRIGGVDFVNLPVAYADSPAFEMLGLSRRPALLLGMDALTLFERVAVDFTNRRVTFDMPDGARRPDNSALAM
ncbi:MAG: aspartyl protease family protein, partial [Sphingomonas sp.]